MADETTALEQLSKISGQLDTLIMLQRAALLGEEKVFRFVHEDVEVAMHFPYISFESLQQRILTVADFYEVGPLRRVNALVKDAVVLDVGANIGNHTLYFAMVAGARSIDSFEPQKQLFRILERNVELNGLTNVRTHNTAVGAASGTVGMNASRSKALGTSSFHEDGDYPVLSIDETGLKPDFVKIDVEGFHLPVLTGARQTLSDHHPLVWIELREKLNEHPAADEILQSLGYVGKPLDRNNYIYRYKGR